MRKAALIFLTGVLFWGCSASAPQVATISGATKCDVRFFNLATGQGSDLLKEITALADVASLVTYANGKLLKASDWCHMVNVADRSANLKVSFYDGSTYKGTLGLGFYDKGKPFLKYHSIGISKVVCISDSEKNEFLNLAGVSGAEFKRIFPDE